MSSVGRLGTGDGTARTTQGTPTATAGMGARGRRTANARLGWPTTRGRVSPSQQLVQPRGRVRPKWLEQPGKGRTGSSMSKAGSHNGGVGSSTTKAGSPNGGTGSSTSKAGPPNGTGTGSSTAATGATGALTYNMVCLGLTSTKRRNSAGTGVTPPAKRTATGGGAGNLGFKIPRVQGSSAGSSNSNNGKNGGKAKYLYVDEQVSTYNWIVLFKSGEPIPPKNDKDPDDIQTKMELDMALAAMTILGEGRVLPDNMGWRRRAYGTSKAHLTERIDVFVDKIQGPFNIQAHDRQGQDRHGLDLQQLDPE